MKFLSNGGLMKYIISFPAMLGLYFLLTVLMSVAFFLVVKDDWSGMMKHNPVLYVIMALCIIAYIQIFGSIYILYLR